MFEILDVAIGVIFVYILVSIMCTAVREGIEAWMKTRAVYLERGIGELLHEGKAAGTVANFYGHPLIYGLFSNDYKKPKRIFSRGRDLPSYIPSKSFATALLDLAARGPQTDSVSADPNGPVISLESVRANVANLQNEPLQRVLLSAVDRAQGDLNKAQEYLEKWFDAAMDRVSGAYKRSTQWIILAIALVVTVGMNVSTVAVANHLYRNEASRTALVAKARAGDTSVDLETLDLPIGWTRMKPKDIGFDYVVGWLLTAFAATLGAPFWFDVLNKVMVIRSTVKPHEKSPEEASEDRQKPVQPQATATAPQTPATSPPPAPALTRPVVVGSPRDADADKEGCLA